MSIPNMISLVRILLTPLFVRFYLEGKDWAALYVLCAAAASDVLDGAIARRFNMITPLGKVLDPVADKLLQLAMLLCLAPGRPAVLYVMALHLVRELGLFFLGLLVYRRSGTLIGSRWYGKACSAALYTFLPAALLWRAMPVKILEGGLFACALMMLFCLLAYGAEYIRLLQGGEEIKNPAP